MTAYSTAPQLARFLRAIADHLDANPHLQPVSCGVHFPAGVTYLQVLDGGAAHVKAWARSLGVAEVTARWVSEQQLSVEFPAVIGGCRVRVWGVAPELADEIGRDGDTVLPVGGAS